MLNRIVLIGRLVADPEERYANSGTTISKFRIAVDRIRRGSDGEKQTDFFNVVCFGHSAEFANRYLRKGYLIAVEGRCQIDQYNDRDGNPRTWIEVNADSVQNLTPRSESEGSDERSDEPRGEPRGERGRSGSGGVAGGGGGGRGRGDWEHTEDFPADDRGGARGGGEGRRQQFPRPAEDRNAEPERGGRRAPAPVDEGGPFDDDDDDPFAEA